MEDEPKDLPIENMKDLFKILKDIGRGYRISKEDFNKINQDKNGNMDWEYHALAYAALQKINPSGIAYDAYLNAIREYEREYGFVDFFPRLKFIKDQDHRNKYLSYFFSRSISSELKKGVKDSMELAYILEDEKERFDKQSSTLTNHTNELDSENKTLETYSFVDLFMSAIKKITKSWFSQDGKSTIERYILTWDFILRNFLEPFFNTIKSSNHIPRSILEKQKLSNFKYLPTHLQLESLEIIFQSNVIYDPLIFLIEDMNVRLRNAFVHEMYYLENETIFYFYIENKVAVFDNISIRELKELNSKQFLKIMLFPRIIGMKLFEDENLMDKYSDD